MKTEIYVFEGNRITFVLGKDSRVMVNATEMAKAFGKDVFQFTRIDSTKEFIKTCQKPQFCGFLSVEKEDDLIISRQNSGTWMHPVLALKFAAWLNPDFEVWVYLTIDKLLFGKYVEREKSLERTISLQKEMNILAEKADKTGEDFEKYLNISYELRKEQAIRKNLTKESIFEMKDLFEEGGES
jgi:hypothetical protein